MKERIMLGRVTFLLLIVVLAACSSLSETPLETESNTIRTYEVKIQNLTRHQAFTPPLVFSHNSYINLFRVGGRANQGIKEIAENGNLAPALNYLEQNRNVFDTVVAVAGDPPPLMPGATITFRITSTRNYELLSYAAMLICTNDGFTGAASLRLPRFKGNKVVVYNNAYDAGSEINTEDFKDIVPPCPALSGVPSNDTGTDKSNPALAEGGVIKHHPGIKGGNDLSPSIHGWRDPVAKITITRIR
jgi:hypothetical protein